MSQRTRSVQWCEGRILDVLGRVKQKNYPIPLALSAMAMRFEIRNLTEQANYDIAFHNLLRQGLVVQDHDEKGFSVVKMAV
jgi:hypothetical protein